MLRPVAVERETSVKVLRAIAIGVGALLVLVSAIAFGARFADGPIALFPGGAFQSGEWVEETPADWSFVADIEEIELQSGEPPTSRTVWILAEGGGAYVPCSLSFPPGKRWHLDALEHPEAEAVVRIEGKRYRGRLEKVQDPALHARLIEAALAKYGGGPTSSADDVWFFLLAPPQGG